MTTSIDHLITTARGGRLGQRIEALGKLSQRVARDKALRDDARVREILIEALASDDASLYSFAAQGLRHIMHPAVTEALITSLRTRKGHSVDGGLAIAEGLGRSADPRALAALRDALAQPPKGMPKAPLRDAIAKLDRSLGA
ncbi:MAG: hypothetical protein K8H88_04015 [Sandaracinaceae bacterium]|nr:hypothetical protein [Sandaracinaceae bacterium]